MDFISPIGVILLMITLLPILLLSALVLSRDHSSLRNRLFFLMGFSICLWASSSIVSDNTQILSVAKYSASLAFGFGMFAVFSAYLFLRSFWNDLQRKTLYILLILSTLASLVSFTPLVYVLNSLESYANGPLYLPYMLTFLVFFILMLFTMIRNYKKADAALRAQSRVVIAGIFLLLIVGTTINAVIPAFFPGLSAITKFGPVSTVFFIVAVGIAIAKHRLFDVRPYIARTTAYLLSIMLISAFFALFGATILQKTGLLGEKFEFRQELIFIIFAILFSAAFQPIRRFFDKVTNKLFYRDAYDSTAFIDQLSRKLVEYYDIRELLIQIPKEVEETINISKVNFVIGTSGALFATYEGVFTNSQLNQLTEYVSKKQERIYYAEQVTNHEIRSYLQKKDYEAFFQLQTSDQALGLLFVSAKRNGTAFSQNDVRTLATVADNTAIAIQNALRFEEIGKFNITLQQKIDDATKELRRTNEKLKALDEAKDEFISMASHQLRTPLTSMKGYVSMVLDGDTGDISEQQRMMLQQAFDSSQRMVYLISDLLNVSRLKTGKFVIENVRTNLANVVESEVNQIHEAALARGLELKFDKPHDFPELYMDETKTRQVIMNFIDNAMYYTPKDGRIDVALRLTDKSVEFTVNDTGVGVSSAEQKHLFTKFYRAQNARKMRPDGTGLGLYMAQKIIIAQGGAIIFKSKLGEGSTFGFSFPLEKVQLPAEAATLPAGNSTN